MLRLHNIFLSIAIHVNGSGKKIPAPELSSSVPGSSYIVGYELNLNHI
jgi:hypothetical protein